MGRMSLEVRRRVIVLHQKGFKLKEIKEHLADEGITISKTSLCLLIKKYKTTGLIADRSRKPSAERKLDLEDLCFIDQAISCDDEILTSELRLKLQEIGVKVSAFRLV